jgi:hypothetical protein
MLDDGVGALSPELRPFGRQAVQVAGKLLSGPLERHGVRRIRLVSLARTPSSAEGGAPAACEDLVGQVRAYTFFAIPYSEVRTVCDSGVVVYRAFPLYRRGR